MELKRALETYTVLTIGDGLVTVIPALMISIAGGLIVTRTASEDTLGARVSKAGSGQRAASHAGERSPGGAGPFARTADHPPSLYWGGGVGVVALRLRQKTDKEAAGFDSCGNLKPRKNLEGLLKLEPLSLDVGLGLVNLVEQGQQSPLLLAGGGHPETVGRPTGIPASGRQSEGQRLPCARANM